MLLQIFAAWPVPGRSQRHLKFHRVLGRIYVISVFIGAFTGIALAAGRPGLPGTSMQAAAWIVCTTAAFITARNRQIVQHRQWMARSYAVTFTFVSSRVLNLWPRYWSHLGDAFAAVGVIAFTLASLASRRPRPQLARAHHSPSMITEKEIPVKTSSLNQISSEDEVLVLGGGVAGCAASIALARKGRSVTLIEREPAPRHKVCGEFLSGEALEDLHALGIDVASLGAAPIDNVRLASRQARCGGSIAFSRSLAHAQGA